MPKFYLTQCSVQQIAHFENIKPVSMNILNAYLPPMTYLWQNVYKLDFCIR